MASSGKRKNRALVPAFEFSPLTPPSQSKANIRHVKLDFSNTLATSRISYLSLPVSPQKSKSANPQDEIEWQDNADVEGHDAFASSGSAPKHRRIAVGNVLQSWKDCIDAYLAEFIRHEGRGSFVGDICLRCNLGKAAFRCRDCFTEDIWCQSCIVEIHPHCPLHRVQEWNGVCFTNKYLKDLGLRVQLGHRIGEKCSVPQRAFGDNFIVIDTGGIFPVGLDFCNCETAVDHAIQLLRSQWFPATTRIPKTAATFRVLNSFQLLSFESRTSVFDFYHSLVRLSDNTGTKIPKNRYPSFLRMVREWRHLKMLKRAGRGHDPAGVANTKEGECAVLCPACPQPGKNLPPGWETAPMELRFLYCLFLAIDANFRLKRKTVSSESTDPSLSQGWSYYVETSRFTQHIGDFAGLSQPRSTCASHSAVNNANIASSDGLASSGVGAVDCARHEFKRPCSVGDLQKGERYANMDFLFLQSLHDTNLISIVVSYDVACQWSINLRERMNLYPHQLQKTLDGILNIIFLVPKFHLAAHIASCQIQYSFNLTRGVGRTDGEAPERGWSRFNNVATQTKEMGPGSRRDTLDDHFGDWNWKKTTGLGKLLLRRLRTAVSEATEKKWAYEQFSSALKDEEVDAWTQEVEKWEQGEGGANPYEIRSTAPTQAFVRKCLAEEEATLVHDDASFVIHEDKSPSAMLNAGIDLENQQRRLAFDIAQVGAHATDHQLAKMTERSNTLRSRIIGWYNVQQVYMPEAAILRKKGGTASNTGAAELLPQHLPLYLPSSIISHIPCNIKIADFEFRLRYAQANDALNSLRHHLRLRSHLWTFKTRFERGQRPSTRARNVIERTTQKIANVAKIYRDARNALVHLSPLLGKVGWEITLRVLEDKDIRAITEDERDMDPAVRRRSEHRSEGRRMTSWIWTTPGVSADECIDLHDSLRIEWSRSRARWMRWHEEVRLLREEMRRVLTFLEWQATWWVELGERHNHVDGPHAEGLCAYGHRQASIRKAIQTSFERQWGGVLGEDMNTENVMLGPEIALQDEEDDSDNEMA